MSTINVDTVLPFSGTTVAVNGVKFLTSPLYIAISNNPVALGIESLALGNRALTNSNSSAQANTALGHRTLENTTGIANTAAGSYALSQNTTGTENTALGTAAGGANTIGIKNVFIGRESGLYNTTGNENTVIGYEAGFGQDPFGSTIGMGNGNTCVGSKTGYQLTGSSFNTFIGYEAGFGTTTGTNNICIGSASSTPQLTASNSVNLGNGAITVLRCAVQTITGLSDARDKKDVTDLRVGLDFINALRPVEFIWDDRNEDGKHDIKDFGFIAQDLKKSQEDANLSETLKLVYEENPEKLEASYGKLVPILVQAIKDLAAKVEILENK